MVGAGSERAAQGPPCPVTPDRREPGRVNLRAEGATHPVRQLSHQEVMRRSDDGGARRPLPLAAVRR